ncbi:MAG: CoA ester lyase [Gemmatimonadota bacterium]|nr:CoA ester lyase [Gemmatimonadota bacterium]
MRSWLFVPGHRQRMIEKAFGLSTDVVIFDLEDGVPGGGKDVARRQVAAALVSAPTGANAFVRVHAAGSPEVHADLRALEGAPLRGLVLPKVQRPKDVLEFHGWLDGHEKSVGLPSGAVRLLATVESAGGLVHAPAIASATPRLTGLMFGAEDFALDMGLFSHPGEGLFDYARSALAVAAASGGIRAIDKVFTDIRDLDGLALEARRARDLGFAGKAVIHPDQVGGVNEIFSPTGDEVKRARRILTAHERRADGGAEAVDGRMVDRPVLEQAQMILYRHGEGRA